MKRLSTAQQRVLDLMGSGWELGYGLTIRGGCWLQENGIGKGGRTEPVRVTTFVVLRRQGLIQSLGHDFPTERFVLAERGAK